MSRDAQRELRGKDLEPAKLSSYFVELAAAFDQAERKSDDWPEGVRFIQISDRLARSTADRLRTLSVAVDVLEEQRGRLKAALVGLLGVSTRQELEQLEAVMRLMPAPAEDKAASIDAIHALLAVLDSEAREVAR